MAYKARENREREVFRKGKDRRNDTCRCLICLDDAFKESLVLFFLRGDDGPRWLIHRFKIMISCSGFGRVLYGNLVQ